MGAIGEWFQKVFGANWKTTLGGILLGVPPLVITSAAGAGVSLGPHAMMVLGILTGIGGLMLGVVAKDKDNHSTADQVQAATEKAKQP